MNIMRLGPRDKDRDKGRDKKILRKKYLGEIEKDFGGQIHRGSNEKSRGYDPS